jgi:hypothetical protein
LTVEPLKSVISQDVDAPLSSPASEQSDELGFSSLLDIFSQTGTALDRATASERSFAAGSGDLQAMIIDRASADAMLEAGSAAASRSAQSLQTILNMQV